MRLAVDELMAVLRRPHSQAPFLAVLACASVTLMGCEVIKGIFKAGVWTGVLGVFAVIALFIWGAARLLRGRS
jgi:hypothetical protein